MHRLVRLYRPLSTRDRGAVSIFTACLLSWVLIAAAVIAVNVGAGFDEHRQVRNGADAASIDVARKCALDVSQDRAACQVAAAQLALRLANRNAADGSTVVEQICASSAAELSRFAACRTDNLAPLTPTTCPPTSPSKAPSGAPTSANCSRSLLSSCPELPRGVSPDRSKYLEVRTRSGTEGQPGTVGSMFGRQPFPVRSCARVGFGPPASLTSGLPITVSKCVIENEYKSQKGGFAPPPPYTSELSRRWETAVKLHESGQGDPCTGPDDKKGPGNFGWIDDGGAGPCESFTKVDTLVGGDTGNGSPGTRGCSDAYLRSLIGTVVYLPVFDEATGTGNNLDYRIIGYTPFFFTGWKLSGSSNTTRVSNLQVCGGPDTCLFGMFTRGLVPSPSPIDQSTASKDRDFGATTVALMG